MLMSCRSARAATANRSAASRVIGVQITSSGNNEYGDPDFRPLQKGQIRVYKVSRTFLFDLLLRELQNQTIRILDGPQSMRAYEQLMQLQIEVKQNGISYQCLAGHHDDLAISAGMQVWGLMHPHLPWWCEPLEPRTLRNVRPAPSARGWT